MGEAVIMPPGWGFRPGAIVSDDSDAIEKLLPELPLLKLVGARDRGTAITQALQTVPGALNTLQPRHLRNRYGLKISTAHDVLKRARKLCGVG